MRDARCFRLQAEVGAWKSKRAAEAARADAADAANARLLAELDSARVQLEVRTAPAQCDVIAQTVAPNMRPFAKHAKFANLLNMRRFALYALGVSEDAQSRDPLPFKFVLYLWNLSFPHWGCQRQTEKAMRCNGLSQQAHASVFFSVPLAVHVHLCSGQVQNRR